MGNLRRGEPAAEAGVDRVQADYTGMLMGLLCALVMADSLQQVGVDTRVYTAKSMQKVWQTYISVDVPRHLEKGRIVIFVAGIGAHHFSTDIQERPFVQKIATDAILMAQNGESMVCTMPPKKDKTQVKFLKN